MDKVIEFADYAEDGWAYYYRAYLCALNNQYKKAYFMVATVSFFCSKVWENHIDS